MGFLGFGGTGPKTILIADDDPRTVRLIKATLSEEGNYRLLSASDGARALATARRTLPHLVILDARMPKRDGYSVCEALKADRVTAKIKVLMVSGVDRQEIKRRARDAGANDCLAKPFDLDELTALVRRLA